MAGKLPRSRSSKTSSTPGAGDGEETTALILLDLADDVGLSSPAEGNASASNNSRQQRQPTSFQNMVTTFCAVVAGVVTCPIWASFLLLWWTKEHIFGYSANDGETKNAKRVKSVDFYSTTNEQSPLVAVAVYTGDVIIWNREHNNDDPRKTLHVSDSPVRCVKFVEQIRSFVTASDDMKIRVFSADTMVRVAEIEAHTDYIRSLCVHPTLPYLFSSSMI
jgi:WD40 repeat protein